MSNEKTYDENGMPENTQTSNAVKIKVKKLHPNAVLPRYAKQGDAGMYLTATERTIEASKVIVKFGLAFEIPEGYVGLIFPRSSIHKTGLILSNSVGVIDSGYRGEVSAVFNIGVDGAFPYNVGERCAQIIFMPYPTAQLEEVEELAESERGTGGFGSTGK